MHFIDTLNLQPRARSIYREGDRSDDYIVEASDRKSISLIHSTRAVIMSPRPNAALVALAPSRESRARRISASVVAKDGQSTRMEAVNG